MNRENETLKSIIMQNYKEIDNVMDNAINFGLKNGTIKKVGNKYYHCVKESE
jgi:hypothetical protein